MLRLVKLTSLDGNSFWINSSLITYIGQDLEGDTIVWSSGDPDPNYCKETPEQVVSLL